MTRRADVILREPMLTWAKYSPPERWIFMRTCVFALLLLFPLLSFAQATSTITGTVADGSGAVVPDALIVVINQQTNQVRRVVADGGGKYTVTFLPVGVYTVVADRAGFATSLHKDI